MRKDLFRTFAIFAIVIAIGALFHHGIEAKKMKNAIESIKDTLVSNNGDAFHDDEFSFGGLLEDETEYIYYYDNGTQQISTLEPTLYRAILDDLKERNYTPLIDIDTSGAYTSYHVTYIGKPYLPNTQNLPYEH
jgi:hypothetical protein